MAVHRRRALEQFLERVPAERQRDRKADRRPEANSARRRPRRRAGCGSRRCRTRPPCPGAAVTRDDPAIGILDPGLAQPGERRVEVGQGLGGGEGLGRATTRVVAGSRPPAASSNAWPSMFDRTPTSIAVGVAAERVDQQLRAQAPSRRCRCAGSLSISPNAPASIASISARIRAWRSAASATVVRRALPALGDMRRRRGPRSTLTISPANSARARRRESTRVGQHRERVDQRLVEMGLRPVEMDPGDVAASAARRRSGSASNSSVSRARPMRLDRLPGGVAVQNRHRQPHSRRAAKCHPRLTFAA